MLLDPFADITRRAWLACPNCDHGATCAECRQRRTCARHWQYLLGNTARVVHLQCPTCAHLWDHDTRPSTQAW
jgi:positive regulator of sigma E activity